MFNELDFLIIYGLLFVDGIVQLSLMKSNFKMHEEHARMINLLMDNLIDQKKKDLLNEIKVQEYMNRKRGFFN